MGMVMGVLNVTPDSFSDGGLFVDRAAAVGHGRRMLSEGAAIIDVGGESTRPGAVPTEEEEEVARVVSVIEELAAEPAVASGQARISIDTRHFAVARAAGLTCCRLDGSPLEFNKPDPWSPGLIVARPDLVDDLVAVMGRDYH